MSTDPQKNTPLDPKLANEPNEAYKALTFEDFSRVDLRVGTVREASRVPKSDKLIALKVDFGPVIGIRQVIAGIGRTFTPDDLVTHQYIFVTNLAPIKLMGLESHGMILATGHPVNLTLITPSNPMAADGSKFG